MAAAAIKAAATSKIEKFIASLELPLALKLFRPENVVFSDRRSLIGVLSSGTASRRDPGLRSKPFFWTMFDKT